VLCLTFLFFSLVFVPAVLLTSGHGVLVAALLPVFSFSTELNARLCMPVVAADAAASRAECWRALPAASVLRRPPCHGAHFCLGVCGSAPQRGRRAISRCADQAVGCLAGVTFSNGATKTRRYVRDININGCGDASRLERTWNIAFLLGKIRFLPYRGVNQIYGRQGVVRDLLHLRAGTAAAVQWRTCFRRAKI